MPVLSQTMAEYLGLSRYGRNMHRPYSGTESGRIGRENTVGPGSETSDANVAGERVLEDRSWERKVVTQAKAGEKEAFGELVEAYSGRVYGHVYRLLRNREESEDVTQETFIRAYRFLSSFDVQRPFSNWLFTIATNLGLNALRSKKRRGFSLSLDADTEQADRIEPISRDEDGIRRVERGELRDRLDVALDELSPQSALLVQLHYREELSIREAAQVIGLSPGAAKVALCRARKRLRELLVGA
jgi:RNA polymerase sigma-70 factor (ECF subfamily)